MAIRVVVALAGTLASLSGLVGCSQQREEPVGPAVAKPQVAGADSAEADPASPLAAKPDAAESVQTINDPAQPTVAIRRVGGDLAATIERQGEGYNAGRCSISTPLPAGYPEPTPPGAIDLKTYPSVRRAEFRGESSPDFGMNLGFWPLFNHIKDRGIAMTSPVEMDYRGGDDDSVGTEWTMSFLYRTDDLGPTGQAGRVQVVDTQPMTVLALGGQGNYSRSRVQDGLEQLRQWLDANPDWRASGEPRALYYNGPEKPNRDKWYEVQIPIRRAQAD